MRNPAASSPSRSCRDLVDQHCTDPAALPMAAMSEIGRHMLATDAHHRPPDIRADHTAAAIAAHGIHTPPIDSDFFDRLIDNLRQRSILPHPSITAADSRRAKHSPLGSFE
ncbi:hypothetical protein [Nocardia sp. NPDC004722]